MAIKLGIEIIKFLNAAKNLVKNNAMSKEGILRFAKQQFGEVPGYLKVQIDKLFKSKPIKTEKKGEVVPIKKQESIGYRKPEEFVTRKEYERYLDEVLGPPDEVFGNPLKDDLLKEWDKVKAKDVTPKEGIETLPESQKYNQALFEQKGMKILKKSLDKQKKELEKATELEKLSSELLEESKKGKKLDLTELDKKLDEIGKERKIRIEKQRKEVEERTGKPWKEGPYIEDDVNLKGETHPKTDQLSAQQREFLGFPNRNVEAIVRAAARDVLEKAGLGPRIKGQDPIDMARQIYGDEILDALDNISGELLEASSYPEIARILTEKKIYNFKPRQGLDVRQKGEIEDITAFDPEGRDPNAHGGLINILKL